MNSLHNPATRADFTDVDGDAMSVHQVIGLGCFGIKFAGTYREFRNTEAPAVALAILRAAGFVPRGNRPDSDSIQESVDTAAGYLDDAVRIADKHQAAQADAALLDAEALALGRAWYDMPDADWDDLNAITGLAQKRATRAAKHIRTQAEATK